MKKTVKSITKSEAIYILQAKLGSLRAWGDFLADNCRDRQSINGLTLLPCCKRHDGNGFRPAYAVDDVLTFIADVKAAIPSAGEGKPIEPVTLTIEDGWHWKLNKFCEDGSPVVYPTPTSTGGSIPASRSVH